MSGLPDEVLGRLVRGVWTRWACEQPQPKPSWLIPWDDLDEGQREVDIRIGRAVAKAVALAERERCAQLARSEAAKLRAGNSPEWEAPCAATLEDFADLLREHP